MIENEAIKIPRRVGWEGICSWCGDNSDGVMYAIPLSVLMGYIDHPKTNLLCSECFHGIVEREHKLLNEYRETMRKVIEAAKYENNV